ERIKTAQDDLARLDRLVSGMERDGDRPSMRQGGTGAKPGSTPVSEALVSQKTSENEAPRPAVMRSRPLLLALAGSLLALCIFGAGFAPQYGTRGKAIMAGWVPPVSTARNEASVPRGPTQALIAQAADAGEQPTSPAAPGQKETKDVPSSATTSADRTS